MVHFACMGNDQAYKEAMEGQRNKYCTKDIICYATQCTKYFPDQAYSQLSKGRKKCDSTEETKKEVEPFSAIGAFLRSFEVKAEEPKGLEEPREATESEVPAKPEEPEKPQEPAEPIKTKEPQKPKVKQEPEKPEEPLI